jgi:NhaP-type Na+/H+ or K+/H+ antiporter
MHEWGLAGIALLLIGYAAVSGRLQSTVVTQAMVFVALGLLVISNRRLPSRIRQGLNVESGLNDGVCVPLLIIFLTIAQAEEGIGEVDPLLVVVSEIGFGAVGGVAAGALGALAMVGTGMRRVTVGFLGWFGPRGLASIVFVLILAEQSDLAGRSLLLDVVTWTVALSVYAHGLTAWPGANRYADWYAAHARDHPAMPESAPVTEPHLRVPAQPSGR